MLADPTEAAAAEPCVTPLAWAERHRHAGIASSSGSTQQTGWSPEPGDTAATCGRRRP